MVFLYFVLPVFLIWLFQRYDYFSLSNKTVISTCTGMLCCIRQLILVVFSVLFSEFNPRLHSHILMYKIQLQHITRWVDLLSTEFIVLSWKLLRCNFMIYYFILGYGFTGKNIFSIVSTYGLHPPVIQKLDNAHHQ